MRKMMTKEVTKTTVKVAKMEMVDGLPQAVVLPDEILLGNISLEKAQKEVNKKYDHPVTVLAVEPDTTVYELEVEKFIEIAKVKVDEPEVSETVQV